MTEIYRVADQSGLVINAVDGDSIEVIEPGHPKWDEISSRADLIPYAPPPVPVPDTISRFQARAALMDAGLLADVELALADADALVQLAWAEATEWRRDSPGIAAIGIALDLAPEQIDDLFRAAVQITA